MYGQKIDDLNCQIKEFLESIKKRLPRRDYQIKLNILKIGTGVEWANPLELVDIEDFEFIPLHAGGLIDMGEALTELNKKLSRHEFLQSTSRCMKPIIIFMTDSEPTDNWKDPLDNIKHNKWYQNSIRIGFAIGDEADESIMAEIVGNQEAVFTINNVVEINFILDKLKSILFSIN